MRKLIHSSFELDLSNFKISDTEENNWFSDSFFTKYSFPFDIDLTDDLDVAFGFISQYNTNPQTYYELTYLHNNRIEQAIFEIESHQERLSCILRFGFEQLPSFDKQLSELSLDKFDLPNGVTIYEHAEEVILETWPDVNYNFPQVHVDKYDIEEELWSAFGGIINNRNNDLSFTFAFFENTVDTVEEITYNRNIMQPMPYWLHILQRGMIDSGYTLSGKILTDLRLKEAVLFADVDYFKTPVLVESQFIDILSNEGLTLLNAQGLIVESPTGITFRKFLFNYPISAKGRYKVYGDLKLNMSSYVDCYFFIKYRGFNVFSKFYPKASQKGTFYAQTFYKPIEFYFETINDINPDELVVEAVLRDITEFSVRSIADLTIDFIASVNSSGGLEPSVVNENKIDLTRSVPAITFGDFVKVVKNWFNYDLTIEGNLAIMNPIEDEINYNATLNLSFTEVKNPLRKFSQGSSFLLKFAEIDNKDFTYLPVFQDRSSVVNSNYVENDKTTVIEVDALPLPLLTRNEVQTTYALESNDSKVYLVKYNGLFNGNNFAQPNSDYLIPAVHSAYWYKWFNFRINAIPFNWVFKSWNERIIDLKTKNKIFAYNRVHIIKTINKTEIKPDLFEVDIQTEAL